MANLSDQFGGDLEALLRKARRGGHVRRTRTMLLAAGLCSVGLVAVAGTMLSSLI